MDGVYERVKRSGFKKFVNLNDRYAPTKTATPALTQWLNKYPASNYYQGVRPQRTSHNARGMVIVC
jgi:hypothetical protein